METYVRHLFQELVVPMHKETQECVGICKTLRKQTESLNETAATKIKFFEANLSGFCDIA